MPEQDPQDKPMDVAKPGNTPPDTTSRPVIVGHKPLVKQDPMMSGVSEIKNAEEQPSNIHTGKVVEPPSISEENEEEPTDETPKSDDKIAAEKVDDSPSTESNEEDVAGDDSIPEQNKTKKEEKGPSEEELKKQEEIQKLTDQKTYFIPIKVASHRRNARWSILVIVVVIMLAGLYFWLARPL